MLYQVVYLSPTKLKTYCIDDMPLELAKEKLAQFKRLYFNEDGTGKAYPNGKGFYPFKHPQIVPASWLKGKRI